MIGRESWKIQWVPWVGGTELRVQRGEGARVSGASIEDERAAQTADSEIS